MRNTLFIICFIIVSKLSAQKNPDMLLTSVKIQLECSEAMDSLYNGNFVVAETQFNWLKQQYPNHPIGYFLMALVQRWKIMPNTAETKYDAAFEKYLDSTIYKADQMLSRDKKNPEANFFMAAAYGFKGQRLAEGDKFLKAVIPGNRAVDYIQKTLDYGDVYGPEFLFGKGLYNYFRVYIDQSEPMLKPIVKAFRKGNMKLGIEQLNDVASTAFYTRVEAMVFLIDIYEKFHDDYYMVNGTNKKTGLSERQKQAKKKIDVPNITEEEGLRIAHELASNLYRSYPLNKYFERKFAELSWVTGKEKDLGISIMKKNLEIAHKDANFLDYETHRSFAYKYAFSLMNTNKEDEAIKYYIKTIELSEKIDKMELGYTIHSINRTAKYYEKKGQKDEALKYFEMLVKNYDKNGNKSYESEHQPSYKYAKAYISKNKKSSFFGLF